MPGPSGPSRELPRLHMIVAGAQRSGTSFLVQLLDRHPSVRFARPLRPEPKFFLGDRAATAELRDYLALFGDDLRGVRVLAEKSTSYMERQEAPENIRRLLPAARLVFVLRDPVERALSNFRFSVQSGVETAAIDEAFRRGATRAGSFDRRRFSVSPFAYLERGEYARYLDRFEDRFPREQITILLFEDLIAEPASVAGRLLGNWGLEAADPPPPARTPVNASPKEGPTPDQELRRFLVRRFVEPNRRLAERYGLDLSRWQGMGEGGPPGVSFAVASRSRGGSR